MKIHENTVVTCIRLWFSGCSCFDIRLLGTELGLEQYNDGDKCFVDINFLCKFKFEFVPNVKTTFIMYQNKSWKG